MYAIAREEAVFFLDFPPFSVTSFPLVLFLFVFVFVFFFCRKCQSAMASEAQNYVHSV